MAIAVHFPMPTVPGPSFDLSGARQTPLRHAWLAEHFPQPAEPSPGA